MRSIQCNLCFLLMDALHMRAFFIMYLDADAGCEGGLLHGGGVERKDISEAYFFKNGRIFTGLTVVE